jgi:HPt (histidine-containing phosphotransfer) domain-containing protein
LQSSSADENLSALSSLGHYLKGSSAALGVARVQETCEKIQHYGHLWDEDKQVALSEKVALEKIANCLKRVKVQYKDAKEELQAWYKDNGGGKD